ncbi:MAG: SpoIIE family protein phosphatase [Ruminococcus sp.]|nr:SpoIIE family protein phosphatase [Ruminococcus sp.]
MKKLSQHVTVKSLAGIISLLVVFSAIVLIIGYNIFTEALLQQYSDGAYLTAKTASSFVNPDDMDDYVNSGGKGKKYTEVWKKLDSICNSSGSTFVYVIIPDTTDYAHIKFIFSTIDHNSPYTIYDFGYVRETTNDEYKVKYKALYDKTSKRELLIRDKGYIETDSHITMMIPLVGKDGDVKGIMCVQRQMDTLSNMRNSFMSKVVFALLILVLIVIVVQSLFLHHTLLKPLKLISEEAARFSTDSTVAQKKLTDSIRNKDEIGALAGSIDHMEEQIYAYIENITSITAEKQRILTELNLATRIQTAMLPNVFPAFPERADFDIYASMNPAKEVGGDFYDFFLVDDDHLCIVMADVSGKGVPAALFMMASKIILANNAMLGKSPKEILTDTNNTICSNNREEMFVSVWLGILELSTGKLTASNAGHEYPVLRKPDGEFELFKDKHGFVIGGMDGMVYSEYEIDLKPGSKLFLYTDGVPEATNAEEELFGNGRMVAALNKDASASTEEILGNVRNAVDEFVKNAEQFDDLTMLCIEYNGDKENET